MEKFFSFIHPYSKISLLKSTLNNQYDNKGRVKEHLQDQEKGKSLCKCKSEKASSKIHLGDYSTRMYGEVVII